MKTDLQNLPFNVTLLGVCRRYQQNVMSSNTRKQITQPSPNQVKPIKLQTAKLHGSVYSTWTSWCQRSSENVMEHENCPPGIKTIILIKLLIATIGYRQKNNYASFCPRI